MTVHLVGAGPGDPGLLTVRGAELLRRADVVVYDRLVDPVLLDLVPAAAERIYVGKAPDAAEIDQDGINALLVEHGLAGGTVVRLKGGDPFVFGRGGEEAEALARADIPFEVVPGVSSALAAPAYAGIPVTHRDLASSFAVVTASEAADRRDERVRWQALAHAVDTLVVLMGVARLPDIVARLSAAGRGAETPVAIVARATTESQQVVTGTLRDIVARAREASVAAPAVIVIGEVATLSARLAWAPAGLSTAAALAI